MNKCKKCKKQASLVVKVCENQTFSLGKTIGYYCDVCYQESNNLPYPNFTKYFEEINHLLIGGKI